MLPVALSEAVYGLVFGVLARQAFLGGPANALAAAVTGFVAARTRNVLLAMIAGAAAAWAARRLIPQ